MPSSTILSFLISIIRKISNMITSAIVKNDNNLGDSIINGPNITLQKNAFSDSHISSLFYLNLSLNRKSDGYDFVSILLIASLLAMKNNFHLKTCDYLAKNSINC